MVNDFGLLWINFTAHGSHDWAAMCIDFARIFDGAVHITITAPSSIVSTNGLARHAAMGFLTQIIKV
ncbi:hypothetical protein ICN48_00755 [Polynucleobacter sp. JS-Safj-400b-B2]|uniref:hypothetical protein n=1 Tax=Polynucleobacter sp. JS-Safj-400b-B2 TaxID=2576921 RepID=UPI001C0B4434|nr:hypothetical protein [Polynucleobacter sp. JS-Safj-400b-B2]MBU3624769.1 hypothetical protein [Polynucleobacter sp. JS-Safj-400b-B2]